jgi:hypothetical protein
MYKGKIMVKPSSRLPDWFPLPIYAQKLTRDEWLNEIVARAGIDAAERNQREGKVERDPSRPPEEVFRSIFVTRKSRSDECVAEAQTGAGFWPVRAPTPFELLFIVENERIPQHADAETWAKKLVRGEKGVIGEFYITKTNKKMKEIGFEPPAQAEIDRHMDVIGKQLPVMVDLDHDDHTLELAFKVWLAGTRDVLKQKASQPIGGKEFAKWTKYGLLQAFDLVHWSRITNAGYTDAFMAKAIWPDNGGDFVDITERYRKVTKPMVAQTFDWDFVQRFWRQVELEKSLDVVVAREKTSQAATR